MQNMPRGRDARSLTPRLCASDDGQDLLEYGLLAALIAVIAIGAVKEVGHTIHTVFWNAIASFF